MAQQELMRKEVMTMRSKHLLKPNTILLIIALTLVIIMPPVKFTYAMSDSGAVADASAADKDAASSDSKDDDKSDSDNDDEDVIEENASPIHGNASSDTVKTSGQMDFYTIRTANNQTYYLVIDHSGAVDNVYLLSTIDENDLEDFIDSGAARNGGLVVLPDSNSDTKEASESGTADTADSGKKDSSDAEKSGRTAGIMSLAVIAAMGAVGGIVFARNRKRTKEQDEYADENLEYDDGIPTVNEDEDL